MGKWSGSGGHLFYSPYLPGNDDPNRPPPGSEFTEGRPYPSTDGKTYATFDVHVKVYQGNGPFGAVAWFGNGPEPAGQLIADVWQTIVDWSRIV